MAPLILNQVASVAEAVEDIALGTAKGPTRLGPLVRVMSADSTMVAGRRAARAHDDAGARIGNVARLQPGIGDGLIHGDMVPGGAGGVKAHGAAVDDLFRIERRGAMDLAAEAEFGIFLGAHDSRSRRAQRGRDFLGIIADRGDNADAGDDDASHDVLLVDGVLKPGRQAPAGWNRPTRMSFTS